MLKPGGVFSGSTAFLEPHHLGAHFRLSADGIVHLFGRVDLELKGLWPQQSWTVFDSLANMPGPLSTPARWLLRCLRGVERFVRARHLHPRELKNGRWMWQKSPGDLWVELMTLAGQIDFVAEKPM